MVTHNIQVKLVRVAPLPYNHYKYRLPLGIAQLVSFLESNGFRVKQQDLFVVKNDNKNLFCWIKSMLMMLAVSREFKKYDGDIDKFAGGLLRNPLFKSFIRGLAKHIDYKNFDVIGLSIPSSREIIPGILLAKYLKQRNRIVILGGSYIKICKEHIAEHFSSFDYLVYTGGELALLKILEYLEGKIRNKDIVPSIIYKENGHVAKNPAKNVRLENTFPPNFDDLIEVSDYKFELNNKPIIPYILTTGCKERCSFCSFKSHDPSFDSKSVNKIVKDLKFLKNKYGSNVFSFLPSSNPYNDIAFFNKILDAFIKERLDIIWESYFRLDYFTESLAKKMKKSGCRILVVGVESGSDKILRYIKKCDISKLKRGLEISKKNGIKLTIQLLVGFPYETKEDIEQTISLLKKYKDTVRVVLINIFALSEDSDMFLNPSRYKITNIQKNNDYPLYVHFDFDETEGVNSVEIKKRTDAHLKFLLSRLEKEGMNFVFGKKRYKFYRL